MTRFNKSLSLAAILAASVSGAALAQSASVSAEADASASTSTSTETASSGSVTGVTSVNAGDGKMLAGSGTTYDATIVEKGPNEAKEAMPEVAVDTGPSQLTNWTYAEVASSLANNSALDTDVSSISASNAMTAKVSELKVTDPDVDNPQLDEAIAANMAELSTMRGMISGNADLAAMIEANGYSSDNVIGVYETANGNFEILIDDRS